MTTHHAGPEPADDDLDALFDDLEETPEDVAIDLMDQFRYQIGRRLEERGWDQKDLAREMDVKPPTVSRLLNGDNTTLLSIAKAAMALDLTVSVLKLVPDEELSDQVDELTPFVRSEGNGAGWWPVTRKRSSHVRQRLQDLIPKETFSAGPRGRQRTGGYTRRSPDDYTMRFTTRGEAESASSASGLQEPARAYEATTSETAPEFPEVA
jgi:transcriptional regulator with XRE-family HTH domain